MEAKKYPALFSLTYFVWVIIFRNDRESELQSVELGYESDRKRTHTDTSVGGQNAVSLSTWIFTLWDHRDHHYEGCAYENMLELLVHIVNIESCTYLKML